MTGTNENFPGGNTVPMVREGTAAFGWADWASTMIFLLFALSFKRFRVDFQEADQRIKN